jgi:sulfatase maturation enzyme AslB (radical SAM superfamily)
MLQFFGGEALLEWDIVQKTIVHASQEAQLHKKDISFVISTNGWSVDKEKLDWLSNYNVKLELSLDGDSDTQNDSRRAADESLDSYANSIATKASLIQQYNFFHDVIMVVPPKQIHKLSHNFIHIAAQGWKRIQINYALGMLWSKEEKSVLASELMRIAKFLVERWKENDPIAFINIEQDPINMRLNGEITIDWDGTLHAGNAFLLKGRKADELVLGRVNDLCNFDRYWLDVADNDILLDSTYHPSITENNLEVGKICNSFIRWMRGQYLQEITQRKMHN